MMIEVINIRKMMYYLSITKKNTFKTGGRICLRSWGAVAVEAASLVAALLGRGHTTTPKTVRVAFFFYN